MDLSLLKEKEVGFNDSPATQALLKKLGEELGLHKDDKLVVQLKVRKKVNAKRHLSDIAVIKVLPDEAWNEILSMGWTKIQLIALKNFRANQKKNKFWICKNDGLKGIKNKSRQYWWEVEGAIKRKLKNASSKYRVAKKVNSGWGIVEI